MFVRIVTFGHSEVCIDYGIMCVKTELIDQFHDTYVFRMIHVNIIVL
jgi:hypothetical protein